MSIRFLFNTSRRLVKPLLGVAVAAAVMQAPAIASAADNPFVLITDPAITPAFNPHVHNYAMKCTGGSVDILTSGPTSYVAGKEYHGTNTVTVPVLPGQQVVVAQPDQRSYHLRCIPDDFPAYTSTVSGPVQSRGFLVQPNIIIGSTTNQPYTVVFDRFGVPVWWYRDADIAQPLDAKFLDATTVAWNVAGIEYVRDLLATS